MKLKITISFLIAIFIYGCDSSDRIWKIFEEEDLLKHPKALKGKKNVSRMPHGTYRKKRFDTKISF